MRTGFGTGFEIALEPLKLQKEGENLGKGHFFFLRQTLVCTKLRFKRDLKVVFVMIFAPMVVGIPDANADRHDCCMQSAPKALASQEPLHGPLALFFMGCFPEAFQEGNTAQSGIRGNCPGGKRLIEEGEGPVEANGVFLGTPAIMENCSKGDFRGSCAPRKGLNRNRMCAS